MKYIFLIIFFISSSFAKDIEISKSDLYKEILTNSYVFIDKTNKITKDKILNDNSIDFSLVDKNMLSYGYSPDFTVWVKFTLKNSSSEVVSKVLEYNNSLTSDVAFFSPDNNYKTIKEGLSTFSNDRKTINPIFEIKLMPKETKTYYLKLSSKITTLIVKLNIWDIWEFNSKESSYKFYLGLFFGCMFILFIYNLFIFIFTKDISYLYYVFYVLGLSFHHFLYVGLANLYFHNGLMFYLMEYSSIIIAFPVIALSLFTYSFIRVEQYSLWSLGLKILTFIVIIFALFITYFDLEYLRNLFTTALLLYLVILTIYACFKRNRQAYFILFGWSVIFLSVLFMILSSSGVFNIFEYFPYIVEVSIVLEATVFSIALADRINSLRTKEKELTNKIIDQKNSENRRLEKKVEVKTKNLQAILDEKNLLLKELNHRVKNNMQMITSLIRLQSREISNKQMQSILLTTQNRISAMSQLHDIFYKQENLSDIDTFDYFTLIVNELSYTYDKNEDINVDFNIQTNIHVEDLLYCGLLLNELVTNCFKHAFVNKNGYINISLSKENGEYLLEVKDNGIGFNNDVSKGDSLGLVLVNSLASEQLNGSIDFNSQDGVLVKIKWRKSIEI